jgi:hypothetical protein
MSGSEIRVPCGRERSHTVYVDDSNEDAIRLWSIVAARRDAQRVKNPALEGWRMNRYRELVGFKVVEKGKVIGESWVPRIGLTSEEWKTYVTTLARACDRLEYLWTGKDVE